MPSRAVPHTIHPLPVRSQRKFRSFIIRVYSLSTANSGDIQSAGGSKLFMMNFRTYRCDRTGRDGWYVELPELAS